MKKFIHLLIVPVVLICVGTFLYADGGGEYTWSNSTHNSTTCTETTWGSYSKVTFEIVSDSIGNFVTDSSDAHYNGIIERIVVRPDTATGWNPKKEWDFSLKDEDGIELQKEESDGSGSITNYGDNLDSLIALNIIDLDVPVGYTKIYIVQPTDSLMVDTTGHDRGNNGEFADTVRVGVTVYIRNIRNLY